MNEATMNNASNFVETVDAAFIFIFGISLFFLFGITIVMVYFVIRYRKSKNPTATHIEGNNTLEIIWTVIPTILVVFMFYYGWSGWRFQKDAPDDAMSIKTIARMWSFSFQYEDGRITDTLYVPVHKPVTLDLVAQDVLHSLYIPAFRLKQDMVPGKKDIVWFESGKVGEYEIFCAEYCGLRHSYMKTVVKVLSQEDFDKWNTIDTSAVPSSADNTGANIRIAANAILRKHGCIACHTSDGSKLVGPSYKGLYGHKVTVIKDGAEVEVMADDDYIRRSIYDPNVEVVKDYPKGMMISYKDQVTEDEIGQLIEYFKTLAN